MDKVFIYWDDSNIFISAQQVSAVREGDTARYRVRLHFRHMLDLACAGREIEHGIAVASIPPELRHVWNQSGPMRDSPFSYWNGARCRDANQGVDQLL